MHAGKQEGLEGGQNLKTEDLGKRRNLTTFGGPHKQRHSPPSANTVYKQFYPKVGEIINKVVSAITSAGCKTARIEAAEL